MYGMTDSNIFLIKFSFQNKAAKDHQKGVKNDVNNYFWCF